VISELSMVKLASPAIRTARSAQSQSVVTVTSMLEKRYVTTPPQLLDILTTIFSVILDLSMVKPVSLATRSARSARSQSVVMDTSTLVKRYIKI
jgi:hypothetical protein